MPALVSLLLVHLSTIGLGVLLLEAGCRIGRGPASLLGLRRMHQAARAGAGFLLGWAALGAIVFGLAAAGLSRSGVIAAAAGAAIVAGHGAWRPESAGILSVWRGIAWPGRVALIAGAGSAGVRLLLPEFDHDALLYHLGYPAQCLAAGRMPLADVPLPFLVPLPVDLAGALPLALRDDRLARWPAAWAMLSVAAVWAGRSLAAGRPFAAWAGPALVLGCGHPLWLVASAKNDAVASASLVAGLVLASSGRAAAGFALAGCGAAGKFVYWPIALAAVAALPAARRRPVLAAALLLLPSIPWWTRTWIAALNPLYPFAAGILPTLSWDARNREAFLLHQSVFWAKDTLNPADLPRSWPRHLATQYLPLVLLLPGLLLAARTRLAAIAGVVGQAAVLGAGHVSRYMLPSAGWLLLLAADETDRRGLAAPGSRNRIAATLAAGWAVAGVLHYPLRDVWRELGRTQAEVRSDALTTWVEAVAMTGRHAGRRALVVGEIKTYPVGARVLYGGVSGETPLVWKIVRESASTEEVRKRYRQLGDPALLYNFVSSEWLHIRYSAFTWDRRMLVVYREFVRRHLAIVERTPTSEYTNGGFALYMVRRRPAAPGPKLVWYLPGTEGVFGTPAKLMHAGRHPESANAFRALADSLPDVGQPANWAAHTAMMTGDFRSAYALLRPFALEGMMDSLNLPQFGECAVRMGRVDEGERALRAALVAYPTQRSQIGTILALALVTKAEALPVARIREAEPLLDEAEAELRKTMWNKDPALAATRGDVVALLLGLRGELAVRGGDPAGAYRLFATAASVASSREMHDRWRRRAGLVSGGAPAGPAGVLPRMP